MASGANALDMALDDVIKTKGSKRGRGEAGGRKSGGKAAGKGAKKPEAEKASAVAPAATKAAADDKAKRRGLGSMRFAKATFASVLAPAAKAAAAAAKASANSTMPGAQAKTSGGGPRAGARAPKAAARAAKAATPRTTPLQAPKTTEAKLGMTLDDMIKVETKRRPAKTEKSVAQKVAEANEGLTAGAKAGNKQRGGRRRRLLKLRSEAEPKVAARAKAQPKAKARAGRSEWNGGGGGKGDWWAPAPKGKGKGWGDWESAWDPRDGWRQGGGARGGGANGGGGADWGGAGTKRKQLEDWGPPAKQMRGWADEPRSAGWGGRGVAWGGRDADDYGGKGKGGGRDRWATGLPESWGGGGRGAREWDNERAWSSGGAPQQQIWSSVANGRPRIAAASGRSGAGTKIKVTNVPTNLDRRDIKEAFEDIGRVIRCEVERGVAMVTFEKATDADKAARTFDRGELNGQTIFVSME